MSDQYGSYDNPYGVRPPFPPEPQPELQAQPGVWPGPLPPPAGLYPPPSPDPAQPVLRWEPAVPAWAAAMRERRPGTVTTAAVLTFVLCGLTVLALLIATIGVIASYVQRDSDPADAISGSDMALGLVMIGLALVVTVVAIVMAGLALGRRQGPRITLVVLSFFCAALVLLIGVGVTIDGAQSDSTGEVVGGVLLLASGLLPLLCAVLLLLPSAGRWYRGRPRATPAGPLR